MALASRPAPRRGLTRECLLNGELAQLREVDFVGSIRQAYGARIGKYFWNRGVLAHAHATVSLHGTIGNGLAHQRHCDFNHRNSISRRFIALPVQTVGGPQR